MNIVGAAYGINLYAQHIFGEIANIISTFPPLSGVPKLGIPHLRSFVMHPSGRKVQPVYAKLVTTFSNLLKREALC